MVQKVIKNVTNFRHVFGLPFGRQKCPPKWEPEVVQKSIKKGVFLWIAVCRATGEVNGGKLEVFPDEKRQDF